MEQKKRYKPNDGFIRIKGVSNPAIGRYYRDIQIAKTARLKKKRKDDESNMPSSFSSNSK